MNFDAHALGLTLPRLSRRLHLHYDPIQALWMLILPEGTLQLNDSAAQILRRCDGRHTIDDIVCELQVLFDTHGIAPEVRALIHESVRQGWLD